MENSIKKDEEILNNIKAYMQENIDKGYHKFVYNDLGHDEKCVDVINAIEHILSDYKRVLKENEEKNKIKEQKECTFREYGAEEGLWYCSNCHDEWLFYEGTPEENNLKYCPHCGAKVIKYESYIETEIEIANKMVKDYLKESEE